jgi:hypothetical protein
MRLLQSLHAILNAKSIYAIQVNIGLSGVMDAKLGAFEEYDISRCVFSRGLRKLWSENMVTIVNIFLQA